MRVLVSALIAVAALQSQPTFRTGVELIRIDVSVADKDGRPVTDLSAGDFVVTIDGAPRKVSFARFYGADAPAPPAPAAPIPTYSTNRAAAPGRIVVFVVDLESIRPGNESALLDTASSLVDRLAPADAVGLLLIPGKGIEITRDHARVREALAALKGFAPKTFQRHVISMQEAIAFDKRDTRVIAQVVERECRRYETECPADLRNETREILVEAHRRIQNVVTTLATLNSRLQPAQAPKDIVVLSAGLPFDQETIGQFRDLQRRVAESGTATHVVMIAQPETDAASHGMAGSGALPAADLRQGLSMVAGVTGGDFFEGVGRAKGAFDRIGNEITRSWQLAVEATPQDADGKTHKIAVSTTRQGLTVRARRELIIANATRAAANPIELLGQPVDAVELPIAAASYSVRGDEAATLKQILLIDAAGIGTDAPPRYALAVLKDDRPVFQTDGELTVAGSRAQAVTAAQLAPGRYRLRVAAVDAAGRGGSLDMPLSVGLRAGGPLQLSDVLVGRLGERFTPVIETGGDSPLGALIELYAGDPAAFTGATVEFELRRSGNDSVLVRSAAPVTSTALPGRRVAETTLATANLQPGDHVVSALVSVNGAPVGKVSRVVAIAKQ